MFDAEPEGWREVRLGDVASINSESVGQRTDPGLRFGYIDISQIERPGVCAGWTPTTFGTAPSRARRRARENDILVSTVRPYLRAFAKVPPSNQMLVASTGFAVVRANDQADQDFLFQHIMADGFVEHLKPRMTGSSYPAVSAEDVADYVLALPPLDEQRRIAEVLGAVDEAMAAARAQADAAFNVLRFVRDELIEEARAQFSEVAVADVLAKNRGEKLRKLQTASYQDTGAYPIVDQGANFICGYTNEEDAAWPYTLPVIVFGDHTRALKFIDFPFAIGADGTQCLTAKAGVHPRFLYYAIQSLDIRSEGYARHFKLLKEKTIPLPDERSQAEIADTLLSLERAHEAAIHGVNRTEEIKKAVASDLLSGRVRVPA